MAKKKKPQTNTKTDTQNNTQNDNLKEGKEIFVYAQTLKTGDGVSFHPVVFELLNKARELSEKYKDKLKVCALVCFMHTENSEDTPQNSENPLCKALFGAGADKVYIIEHKKIKNFIAKAHALTQLCRVKNPEIFLTGATTEGRSIAPLVSSALDTGLTADCTKLEITNYKDEKKLAATRPTFGGQLMATILCKKTPQMATVRPSVLLKAETPYSETGEFEKFVPELDDFYDPIEIIKRETTLSGMTSELEGAQIIVAGGRGLKTEENFNKLKRFAELAGAAYGGSRGAVDNGLIEKDRQIGQTGKTVAPKVYIAFGISGAIHHITGVSNAGKIIAVNSDENAPIFEHSDVAIVEDAAKVLDELIADLEV